MPFTGSTVIITRKREGGEKGKEKKDISFCSLLLGAQLRSVGSDGLEAELDTLHGAPRAAGLTLKEEQSCLLL